MEIVFAIIGTIGAIGVGVLIVGAVFWTTIDAAKMAMIDKDPFSLGFVAFFISLIMAIIGCLGYGVMMP